MANIGTLADQLKMRLGATEITHVVAVGALPGTTILFVAAKNGTGEGRLRIDTDGMISWRAPDSDTFGPGITAETGTWLLHDGEESDQWIRLQIWEDYLPSTAQAADVLLTDIYGEIAGDDTTAAQAAAGQIVTAEVILENVTSFPLIGLVAWLEGNAMAGFRDLLSWMWKRPSYGTLTTISISGDNITFVTPVMESNGLALAAIAPGATITLYVKRTVGADSTYSPAAACNLRLGFNGI